MDDRTVGLIKDMLSKKGPGYFKAHALGDLLEEAGVGRDPAAVRKVVQRLAGDDDDVYAFILAISSGVRETASDDDEFAGLVSRIAGKVRFDLADGPFIRALVEAGKDNPRAAASLAARLVGLGDADYAAYLAGGAYAGAPLECAELAESLFSSDDPDRIAAGIRVLRVAHAEHRAPGAAGRIADMAAAALRIGHDPVSCEAMESLLDIYGDDPAAAGPLIEALALRRPSCRPALAGRIANRSPFDSGSALRHLETCAAGLGRTGGTDADLHDICRALAGLAGEQPAGVARALLGMAAEGAYEDRHGGRVLEELGRRSASVAAAAILDALLGPDGPEVRRHLPSMIRRLSEHADMRDAAGPFLASVESGSAARGDCLDALDMLAAENRRGRRDRAAAAALLGRLLDHAASAGLPARGRSGAGRDDPDAALRALIGLLRRPCAVTAPESAA